MRPYRAIFQARARSLLQYRAAAAAGVFTQFFWGFMLVMVYQAFYRSSTAEPPMSLEQVIAYVWLGQAFFALVPWRVDPEMFALFRTGAVAHELLRPVDLYGLWFARATASRVAPTALRLPPVVLLAVLAFGFGPPPSWAAAGAFGLATLGAVLLGSALLTLVTVGLFWTLAGEGLTAVYSAGVFLLSGMIVPLPLFPAPLRRVLEWLPFRGVVDTPFRLYVGHLPAREAGPVLLHQLAWTVVLVLLGRALLARGQRRLVVQGG